MIITDNGKKLHYIKKIMNEQLHQVYRVRSDGTLEYDHQSLTGKYLAYIDGRWYGAHNGRHGSSEGSMEEIQNAKFLFAITQDRLWLSKNDGTVEYSSPSKKLSDSTISFLLAKQSNKVCMFIIDGNQFEAPLMTAVCPEHDNEEILIHSVIALTRQYDADAADEMYNFWYTEQENSVLSESLMDSVPVCRLRYQQHYPYDEDDLI